MIWITRSLNISWALALQRLFIDGSSHQSPSLSLSHSSSPHGIVGKLLHHHTLIPFSQVCMHFSNTNLQQHIIALSYLYNLIGL